MSVVDRVTVDFQDTLKEWAEGLIKTIQSNMERLNVNATGETSASLEYVLTDSGIQILGVPFFAERTEVGRTPTARKDPWDWRTKLSEWIKAKGLESQFNIQDERDLQKVVRAIYWKITKKGSSKYRNPEMRTDVYSTAVTEAVDELSEKLLTGAGERLMGVMDELARMNGDKVSTTKIN